MVFGPEKLYLRRSGLLLFVCFCWFFVRDVYHCIHHHHKPPVGEDVLFFQAPKTVANLRKATASFYMQMLSRLSCLQIYNYYDFGQDFGRFLTQYHKILHAVWCSTNIAIGKFTIHRCFLLKGWFPLLCSFTRGWSLAKKKNNSPLTVLSEMEENRQKNRPADKLAGGRFNAEPAFAGFVPVVSFRTQWQWTRRGHPEPKRGEPGFFLGGSLVENPKRKISDKFFPTTKKLAPKNLSDLRNLGFFGHQRHQQLRW